MQVHAQCSGIKGKVEWISGNQMPGPDKPVGKTINIQREIWIYEAVSIDQVKSDGVFFSEIPTKLVKKAKTKSTGNFKVKLPPGEYSIFIKEENGLFANRFDGQSRISYVEIKRGKFTQMNIRIDYEAAY